MGFCLSWGWCFPVFPLPGVGAGYKYPLAGQPYQPQPQDKNKTWFRLSHRIDILRPRYFIILLLSRDPAVVPFGLTFPKGFDDSFCRLDIGRFGGQFHELFQGFYAFLVLFQSHIGHAHLEKAIGKLAVDFRGFFEKS